MNYAYGETTVSVVCPHTFTLFPLKLYGNFNLEFQGSFMPRCLQIASVDVQFQNFPGEHAPGPPLAGTTQTAQPRWLRHPAPRQ